MPFKFKCRNCKEFIYTDNLSEENTLYKCENCKCQNSINSDFEGLIEIDKDGQQIQREELKKEKQTLSHKYSVLRLYQGLAFLLMLFSTVLTIYSFGQLSDASNAMKKYGGGTGMDNAMLTLVITYFITIFSLFCLIKMIDFLFDLDKDKSDK